MDTEISIVILDVRMPRMNGIELCKKIKAGLTLGRDRDVEIIIMTGHPGLTEAIESVSVGVFDFLKKPLSIELLQFTVGKANQKINDSQFKRKFHEMLKSEVARKTQEIQQKSIELEAINTKLMLANQVKNEFLRMMNHELRTPLHQIIGFSRLLESQLEDKKQCNLLEMIKVSGEHLTDMITIHIGSGRYKNRFTSAESG
jgi:DNA-binding NtrC family response regulator